VIDDRLSALIDNGDVLRVQRGVFIPASTHRPARVISRTIVPDDGTTVLEIGDQVVTLTPREARILGELMAGAGQNFASIELGHQSAKLVALLSNRVDKVSRKTALMGRFQSTPDVQSTPDAGRQQRLEGMTQ
jgi:hypothetical protein